MFKTSLILKTFYHKISSKPDKTKSRKISLSMFQLKLSMKLRALLNNLVNRKNSTCSLKLCFDFQSNSFLLTNSNTSSISSNCFSSLRDSLCVLLILLAVPLTLGSEPADESFWLAMLRKVGVPSIVFTIGFNNPPRSNSCAEIFLQCENKFKENCLINLNSYWLPHRCGSPRSTAWRTLLIHVCWWWNEHHHVVACKSSGSCMSH